MLSVNTLTKVYGKADSADRVHVLDGVSFDVPENQFVCLLGSSGCGKTTLLRIVAGLTEQDFGVVQIAGHEVHGPGQDRSMVFQNYGLLPWRTVFGNVEFALEVRGAPRAERREICQEYINRVGLGGFENHYPHQISGGMQQRVALARAFSKSPKILLMDEPFAAVDMQTRETLQDELLQIWNSMRTTVLFVTHAVDEAIYLGDRVIVMGAKPGHIKADVITNLPRPRSESDKSSHRFEELRHIIRDALHDKRSPHDHRTDMDATLSGAATAKSAPAGPLLALLPQRILRGDYGLIVRVLSVAATLGVWEWFGRSVNPVFASYPSAIFAAVPEMVVSGRLPTAFLQSLQSLSIGLSLAVIFGTTIGLLMGRYRLIDQILDTQISALYSTPNVALIPLFILWFGLGLTAKVAIVFMSAFFPIIVNTYSGVRNVSRGLVEVALAETANEAQIFSKIVAPAALPFIATGFRLAIGRAVVSMVVAEMFLALSGLGGAIVVYGNAFSTDKLFVVIIVLALLGVSLTESVRVFERKLAVWKETERAS
jgi:NitT/TauT family transport system ATP-binding protein